MGGPRKKLRGTIIQLDGTGGIPGELFGYLMTVPNRRGRLGQAATSEQANHPA